MPRPGGSCPHGHFQQFASGRMTASLGLWVGLAENLENGGMRSAAALKGADLAVVPVHDRVDVLAKVRLAAVLPGDADEGGELDLLVAGHASLIAARRRSRC